MSWNLSLSISRGWVNRRAEVERQPINVFVANFHLAKILFEKVIL